MTRILKIKASELRSKKITVSKDVKIKCNSIKIGKNVKIYNGVQLFGDKILINDDAIIGSNSKITSKIIEIGNKSKISEDCNIFVLEKFSLGDRSILCTCEIKGRYVKIGDDFFSSVTKGELLVIGGGNSFYPESNLFVGDRCTIHDVYINIAMPVKIGDDVGISHGTKFFTHYFWNSIFEGHPQKFSGITIGDGCIIGAESFFLPGATLGKNCIVGAGSVISKRFPSSCMIVGNPPRIVRKNYRKKISSKKRIELMKRTLSWYVNILKTKGFKVKKLDRGGMKILVRSTNGKLTYIIHTHNPKEIQKFTRPIVLTFKKLAGTKNYTEINLSNQTINGPENEFTDDLRDFLRKVGIRIFSDRKFKSFPPKIDF